MTGHNRELILFFVPGVKAVLKNPAIGDVGSAVPRAFIRSYYAWARSADDAIGLVTADVKDDADLLEIDVPEEADVFSLPPAVMDVVMLDQGRGVCWRSGRVFFG